MHAILRFPSFFELDTGFIFAGGIGGARQLPIVITGSSGHDPSLRYFAMALTNGRLKQGNNDDGLLRCR